MKVPRKPRHVWIIGVETWCWLFPQMRLVFRFGIRWAFNIAGCILVPFAVAMSARVDTLRVLIIL